VGAPKPTPAEVEADARLIVAGIKRDQIDAEFERGASAALGFRMTVAMLDWWTETYTKVIKAAASNPITEADTPLWYKANQWRAARNQLRSILNAAVDCPSITVEQIYDFDVLQGAKTITLCGTDYNWDGWPVA
jgi:hypothetical protein